MLGRNAGVILRRRPPEYVWGDTLPLFREADVVLVNLECVIAGDEAGDPWPRKVFHFKAPPAAVEALRAAHVTAVTLANNHTLDYGPTALEEMLGLLGETGIPAAGAGRTPEEARRAVTLKVEGLRIGLINCTDNEPGWEGRAGHDLVIVAAHWGPDMSPEPLPHHPPFARALADAGADLFIGTSAHVVQGIELYRVAGRPGGVVPICYDLGDYVDDYAVDPDLRNDRSFLFVFDLDRTGVRGIHLQPILIDGWRCQVKRARGADAAETMATMVARCRKMGTSVGQEGGGPLTVDVETPAARQ